MKVLLLSITLLLLTTIFVMAQPNDPPQVPDRVPITGIEYLLIAGGAYGVHRFSKKRGKKNSDA
jgi:hypothetical protein